MWNKTLSTMCGMSDESKLSKAQNCCMCKFDIPI